MANPKTNATNHKQPESDGDSGSQVTQKPESYQEL